MWALNAVLAGFSPWGIESASAGALRIGVAPTQDRWLTFADGERVFQGAEISYLLVQAIHNAGWAEAVLLDPAQPTVVDFVIRPTVEALVYSSGSRSNRQVLGFTPEFSTPFDQNNGSRDNEYIASQEQVSRCERPDFFGGGFTPSGWGPFKSNFGVNADEGFRIKVAGYGIEFRSRKFQVRSQVRFELEDLHTGTSNDFIIDMNAKGRDAFVGLAYQGIELGVEVQRRKTLLAALKEITPKMVEAFQSQLPFARSQMVTALMTQAVPMSAQLETELDLRSKEFVTQQTQSKCVEKKEDLIADILNSLLSVYGWLRYKNVFDQEFIPHGADYASVQSQSGKRLRIAVVDSGVDPKDEAIARHLVFEQSQVVGYDFTSWDRRPSDDNGHGTAVAHYLDKTLGADFDLIPIKVIGGRGETHSSAIFAGLREATRLQPDAVLIAWDSIPSNALKEGVWMAVDHGIEVFSQVDLGIQHPNLHITTKDAPRGYKVRGLGASLKLSGRSTSTINELKNWAIQKRESRGKQ